MLDFTFNSFHLIVYTFFSIVLSVGIPAYLGNVFIDIFTFKRSIYWYSRFWIKYLLTFLLSVPFCVYSVIFLYELHYLQKYGNRQICLSRFLEKRFKKC